MTPDEIKSKIYLLKQSLHVGSTERSRFFTVTTEDGKSFLSEHGVDIHNEKIRTEIADLESQLAAL